MTTRGHFIEVSGIQVEVVRKAIKNLHLGVYPPLGRVRVAVPLAISDDAVRLAVISRLGWIRRQQAKFSGQERQSGRDYVSGESHYFLGRRYRIKVIERPGPAQVIVRNGSTIALFMPENTDAVARERVIQAWYRKELRQRASPLLEKWTNRMELPMPAWGIKRMKTKWGSCNIAAKRIWLNLELIKKPVQCLEYIIVHELVHFFERHHNERFAERMDHYMPLWRSYRDELNATPLRHENWDY